MSASDLAIRIEGQIEQWRSYLRRRQPIHSVDVEELEDHLREQVSALVDAGLADDWKRESDPATRGWMAAAFVGAAVFANIYPHSSGGYTQVLTALHLPIALWLVVGIAYAGGRWSEVRGAGDVRAAH